MPTSRQRQRRDRLFTAAQQAVVMRGADVRLKDIADMAGLTSGAILYHYPDVQSLLLEANQAVIERFLDNRVKAIRGLASPAEKLVVTVAGGLPVNAEDADVKLLCALGGAASRYPAYAAMLTSLYDRQVAMYQVILERGRHRRLRPAERLGDDRPQHRRPRGRLRLPDGGPPRLDQLRRRRRADPVVRPPRDRASARSPRRRTKLRSLHVRDARAADRPVPARVGLRADQPVHRAR